MTKVFFAAVPQRRCLCAMVRHGLVEHSSVKLANTLTHPALPTAAVKNSISLIIMVNIFFVNLFMISCVIMISEIV